MTEPTVEKEEVHPSSPLLSSHHKSIPFPEVLRFGFNGIICFFLCFDLDKEYAESLPAFRAQCTWRLGPVCLPRISVARIATAR